MKKTRGFLLAAGISLALAFTISCDSGGGSGSGGNTSSSSVVGGGGSSSSVDDNGGNSSSSDGPGGGYTGSYGSETYCGQAYKTVQIGTQTWMAENLNCDVAGSRCYEDNSANCAKYGRLYDWATAMNIEADYNSDLWDGSDVKHRGICPSGWHIPSNEDWDKLYRFADGTSGTSSPYDSPTAGKYLKAMSGWNNRSDGSSGNGTDAHGFSALPGGDGDSGGNFGRAGSLGNWWSSSEGGSNYAYYRNLYYNYEHALWDSYDKSHLFSVRCLQD